MGAVECIGRTADILGVTSKFGSNSKIWEQLTFGKKVSMREKRGRNVQDVQEAARPVGLSRAGPGR